MKTKKQITLASIIALHPEDFEYLREDAGFNDEDWDMDELAGEETR